jgi:phytoene dehydrogenase-like protein
VRRAGTVHLATSMDELTLSTAHLTMGLLPADPFVLLGQMTTADPTRSPSGTESIWAYTDVPQHVRGDAGAEQLTGVEDAGAAEAFADRMQARIERMAPGFEGSIRVRQVQTPASMERDDANLVNGDKSLGSAQLHQQLVFRPFPGLARPETPIPGLFLASGSAHPGGGVHGACGAHAARAAIWARRRSWLPVRRSLPTGATVQ